jgi:hypothetical protein
VSACRSRGLRILWAIPFIAVLLGACDPSVRENSSPASDQRGKPVRIVAVVPFDVAPLLRDDSGSFAGSSPQAAAGLVTGQVAETLRTRNVIVIPASEVRLVLSASGLGLQPAEAGQIVAKHFGADAFITGRLTRWAERQGTAAAASRGASVAFKVILFDAPAGAQLWSGTFDRTQRPLSENVLQMRQLPGGGSRWVTAEELARWGAERVARQVPVN